jgi:hypothetical protein
MALRAGVSVVLVGLSAATAAAAAPEEIEVYRGEMNAPGAVTLETNQSYVFSSRAAPDYPGQEPSVHRYRLTPELSYGLTPELELGALAAATVDRDGAAGVHGFKVRARYVAPHRETGFFWGGNLEIGRVDRTQSPDPWGVELRGIFGFEGRRWIFAINPVLEGSIGGPAPEPVSLELASKLGYRVDERLILGLESYNAFGPVRDFERLRDGEQMLYLTADAELKRFDINFGAGHGLSPASDHWTVKAVIGVPLS